MDIETLRTQRANLAAQIAEIDAQIRDIEDAPLLVEADALSDLTRAALLDFSGAWHEGGINGYTYEGTFDSPNDPGYELCHRLTSHGAALVAAMRRRRNRGA